MGRQFLIIGALSAFLAVAAGAFGAHAIRGAVSPDRLEVWETAARYQMYHALALFAAAWGWSRWQNKITAAAGWLFVAGILVFSGSLYLLALTNTRWLGMITPPGGLALLAGWICLGIGANRATN